MFKTILQTKFKRVMRRFIHQCLSVIVVLIIATSVAFANPSANAFRVGSSREIAFPSGAMTFAASQQTTASASSSAETTPTPEEQEVHSLADYVKAQNRYIDRIDSSAVMDLPAGIASKNGTLDYTIIVKSLVITPDSGAYLEVCMSFEIPQNGRKIAFVGKHIPFSFSGGVRGNALIELLGDQSISLSSNINLILKGNGGTSVAFDCNGFKSMSLDAQVEFSANIVIPEKPDGSLDNNNTLKTSFKTTMYDWNDLVLDLSIPAFQMKNLPGVGFYVKHAVFDFSDLHNAPSMTFPKDYQSSYFSNGVSMDLWRGFYIQEADIKLPKEFKKKGSDDRIALVAQNLLIDEHGLSGTFGIKNLLDLSAGDMDGWAFSIEDIAVTLVANQLTEGKFGGVMNIPMLKENSTLNYSAIISTGGNYSFTVSPDKPVEMSLWAAQLVLQPTSTITIAVSNGKFVPEANLTGSLTITKSNGDDSSGGGNNLVAIAGITFENLILRSQRPFIQIGTLSLGAGSPNNMGNFPIIINKIGLTTDNEKAGITFNVIVNFMGTNNEGFGGSGNFVIWGKRDSISNRWKYHDTEVKQLTVDIVKKDAFELHGSVTFFHGDATYGKGFNGKLNAIFGSGIGLKATAIFGCVNDMRYWYADAMINIGVGIPLCPGLSLYGFGGGVYHHMRQKGFGETNGSSLGASQSGIIYVPTSEVALGLKASVSLGTTKKEVLNGDATFEISFNSHGGINQVGFQGNVYLITAEFTSEQSDVSANSKGLANGSDTPPKSGDSNRAQIWGTINLLFDNANSVFHGELQMYANVAGGAMRGIGAQDLAGWAVIHFAPKEWYIYIGTPTNPVGMEIARILKTKSYFMAGFNLPGSPPPPAKVSEILGGMNLDYMRNLNDLKSGMAIAFGASYEINTGDITYLIFYARLQAGVGFDIMLKDYKDAICEGRNGQIGINGWFANGQVYAYVEGKIGIKVDLMFYKGNYEILSVAAAAVLQAKGPNPFWMRGVVGGQYNILNGLVKGKCKFEFSLGEECKIATSNPLGGIQIISQVTPSKGSTDVDVFNTPQAVFNMALNKDFVITDEDGNEKTFRIKLDHFTVTLPDKSVVPGTIGWNNEYDVAAFNNTDILPSQKSITVSVQVSFEQKVGNSWVVVFYQGKKAVENMESTFTSGIAPDFIPTSNVQYAYPIINQYNFYKDEYNQGYIKLKKGQPDLFVAPQGFVQRGRTKSASGTISLFNIAYSNTTVTYSIPQGLANGSIHTFDIVNLPAAAAAAIDRNVSTVVSNVNVGQDNAAELNTKKAEGNIETLQEKTLLTYNFRTSKYSTFNEKLNSMSVSSGWRRPIRINVHELGVTLEGDEMFDLMETHWNADIVPVVQFEAVFAQTDWYNNIIYPLLYDGYPLYAQTIDWRDVSVLGMPPSKAAFIRQYPNDRMLTPDDVAGNSSYSTPTEGAFVYNVAHFIDQDFYNIRNKVGNYCASHSISNARITQLLNSMFPGIKNGDYPLDIKYVLPGLNTVTTTKRLVINNPIL